MDEDTMLENGSISRICMFMTVFLMITMIMPTGMTLTGAPEQGATRATSGIDSWTMFRGDLKMTGISGSTVPTTAKELWNTTIGDEIYSTPIVGDGMVFIGSWTEMVHALDALSGEEKWTFDTGEDIYSTGLLHENKLYIGTGTEMSSATKTSLYCLNAADGNLIWEFETDGRVYGAAVVADGKLYVGGGKYLLCLDPTGDGDGTTTKLWEFETGGDIWSTPSVEDGKVYITSYDCKVYCVDANTGTLTWSHQTRYTPEGMFSSVTISGDYLYLGSAANDVNNGTSDADPSNDGAIFCLDKSDGSEIWTFPTGISRYGVCTTPSVHNGNVFFGSNNGVFYSLNANSGAMIWNFTTDDNYNGIYASATIADGKVLFGSSDSVIYCLDEATGDTIWTYQTKPKEYGVVSSPTAVDGLVYVGSTDGTMYCFGEPQLELAGTIGFSEASLESNQVTDMTVTVTASGDPVEGVIVNLEATGGTLSALSGTTGADGTLVVTYQAPITDESLTLDINVTLEKTGYKPGSATKKVLITKGTGQYNPALEPTLGHTLSDSGDSISVTVTVKAGMEVIEGANVKVETVGVSDEGPTDTAGLFATNLSLPAGTTGTIQLRVDVTKGGYKSATLLENITIGAGEEEEEEEEEEEDGTTRTMEVGDSETVGVGKEDITITLDSIDAANGSATLTIDGEEHTIEQGDSVKIDTDGNDKSDLDVEVGSISDGKVTLKFSQIEEKDDGDDSPGFGTLLLLTALGVVGLAMMLRGRRREH